MNLLLLLDQRLVTGILYQLTFNHAIIVWIANAVF
jgi:hypothetical protein